MSKSALLRSTTRVGWFVIVTLSRYYLYRAILHRFLTPDRRGPSLFNKQLWYSTHLAAALPVIVGAPLQFIPSLRQARPALHRLVGRGYVIGATIAALTAIYLGAIVGEYPGSRLPLALLGGVWLSWWPLFRGTPRRARMASIVAGMVIAVAAGCSNQGSVPSPAGWKLTWSDEFDGPEIDQGKWDFDLGNGFYNYQVNAWINGWGNNELQCYTREPRNVFVTDGMLHIRAVRESLDGCGYTSARLKSRKRDGGPLFSQTYGRIEFRAKLPTGQGVWSALWMLPQDDKYGSWAASGEIDIMEALGHEPTKVLGTLHFGSRWPANTHVTNEYVLPGAGTIADFHDYAVEWEPGEIRWSVDGQQYATQSFWWSSSKTDSLNGALPTADDDLNPWPAPFDQPFYLIMNVAIGGELPGPPDSTTVFPVAMVVDYVRVYEKVGGYGAPKPRGAGELPYGNP